MSHIETAKALFEERTALAVELQGMHAAEASAENAEKAERMAADLAALDAKVSFHQNEAARAAEFAGLEVAEAPVADETPAQARSLAMGETVVNFEERDLVVGTDTAGGHSVKTSLAQAIYQDLTADNDTLVSAVDLKVTANGEPMEEVTTGGRSVASLVAENGAIGESNPDFGIVTLGAYKLGFHIPVSAELEQDAYAQVLPFVQQQAVEALRDGMGELLISGTGSSQPQGIMAAGSTPVETAAAGGPSYEDLVEIFHSVLPAYRRSSSWIFNDSTIKEIRLLTDVTNGRPLWQPSMQLGQPDTILGRPVLQDAGIDTVASSAQIGAFGDFRRGVVARMAGNIRAERSTDYAFLNDKVVYKFTLRFDSKVRDTKAFTIITNPA